MQAGGDFRTCFAAPPLLRFAHEAAWKDTGGDAKRAQEEYVKYTEEVNDLEPGSLSK
jgi:hypothetical protein